MGFRDDFEATSKRAESLDRELKETREELEATRGERDAQQADLDRWRDRLRSLGFTDEAPPHPSQRTTQMLIGGISICLGLAMLVFQGLIVADWQSYLEEDLSVLRMLRREAYIDLAVFADTTEAIVLASLSVILCVIGVGSLLGHRWAAVASLVWGTVALAFNGFTAVTIYAIFGTMSENGMVGGVVSTILPVVMFVYGLWATWRLIAPWAPRSRELHDGSAGGGPSKGDQDKKIPSEEKG